MRRPERGVFVQFFHTHLLHTLCALSAHPVALKALNEYTPVILPLFSGYSKGKGLNVVITRSPATGAPRGSILLYLVLCARFSCLPIHNSV